MWIKDKPERLPTGMLAPVVFCSKCGDRVVFISDIPAQCPHCLTMHNLIRNEDGSMDTMFPTEEELSEIEKLRKENRMLKEKLALYSMYSILHNLMHSDDEDS